MRGLWAKRNKLILANALPISLCDKTLRCRSSFALNLISCRSPLPMPDANSVVLFIVSSAVQRFLWGPRNAHNFNVIFVASF